MAQEVKVLGVDLGPSSWQANGSALLSFLPGEPPAWRELRTGVLHWPDEIQLTPTALASLIDAYCVDHAIAAVGIDGPQGWRDPLAAPDRPGVGRVCEKSARTPGKTGVEGTTYPANQVGWISFSIKVFAELLQLAHVSLANDPFGPPLRLPVRGTYVLLECFPTSTWRASGLGPLPAKGRKPDLELFADTLCRAFRLPALESSFTHDDLQAVVAALPAAALFGAARTIAHGEPARLVGNGARQVWVEGLIWDAAPLTSAPADRLLDNERLEELQKALEFGPLYSFSDWPNPVVPHVAAGVYSIWRSDELLYVGMSGRSLTSDEIKNLREQRKKGLGLYSRLNSHASGRRSGDQFCVYLADRLILPSLTERERVAIASGELHYDTLIRDFVRNELSYRFVETRDAAEAHALERELRMGVLAPASLSSTPPVRGRQLPVNVK